MTSALEPLVWPFCFLLIALLVLRKVSADVRPIFQGVTQGLRLQSSKYATLWAMACLYAAGASFQALADVAGQLGWVYVAAFAKVVQPGVVAVIAYVNKAPPTISEPEQPKP